MKKCRKIVSFLLIVTILISFIPDTSFAATKTYKDSELTRAVALGIGTYAKNEPVTYKKFFHMLDEVVTLGNPSALKQWKKKFPMARKSNKTMKRDEGMLAMFYTAKTLGEGYNTYNADGVDMSTLIGATWGEEASWDYPLFPGWDKSTKFGNETFDNAMIAACIFCTSRESQYSDKLIFDYDQKSVSMRLAESFTYEEALLAALRLYDSNLQLSARVPTKEDAKILQAAQDRKNEILNSKSEVTVKGTSYYVSNSGNDNNDGKTPETAWATVFKVNNTEFSEGDGVFFERGGTYRGTFRSRGAIIYSAYGEGDKPKIYGSPENGAGAEKWTLMKGTKNIWIFYKELYDTGGIIFNEGESWAARKTAIWDGTRYVDVVDKKTPINVKKIQNLQFYNPVDYTGFSTKEAGNELDKKGKIYLRCDAGNPGEVYESIEFLSKGYENENPGAASILQVSSGCMIDNLCLMYGQNGVSIGGNTTVQNCEIGWIGGIVAGFNGTTIGSDTTAVIRCGDGILCATGSKNLVQNNYVHHIYDFGLSIETGGWQTDETRFVTDTSIKGNLVEACSGDMIVADFAALDSDRGNKILYENIIIEDNYLMPSGYGWSHLEPSYDWGRVGETNNGNCTIYFSFPAKAGKNICVKNNVFYLAKYALIGAGEGSDALKQRHKNIFSGNTYVQNTYGILAVWVAPEGPIDLQKYHFSSMAEQTIAEVLGDKTAVVLIP